MSEEDAAVAMNRIIRGDHWTADKIKRAVAGEVVGTPGKEPDMAMRRLFGKLKPLSKLVAADLRVLAEAAANLDISPDKYASVYAEVGVLLQNATAAYKRAQKNITLMPAVKKPKVSPGFTSNFQ